MSHTVIYTELQARRANRFDFSLHFSTAAAANYCNNARARVQANEPYVAHHQTICRDRPTFCSRIAARLRLGERAHSGAFDAPRVRSAICGTQQWLGVIGGDYRGNSSVIARQTRLLRVPRADFERRQSEPRRWKRHWKGGLRALPRETVARLRTKRTRPGYS